MLGVVSTAAHVHVHHVLILLIHIYFFPGQAVHEVFVTRYFTAILHSNVSAENVVAIKSKVHYHSRKKARTEEFTS